jgi:hypothetical protein
MAAGELQFLDDNFVGIEDGCGGFVFHWLGKDMIGVVIMQDEELGTAGT